MEKYKSHNLIIKSLWQEFILWNFKFASDIKNKVVVLSSSSGLKKQLFLGALRLLELDKGRLEEIILLM